MAKNVTKSTYQHVTRTVKTPAQKLKAEQNVAAAAARLKLQQLMSKYAKLGRAMGMTGRTEQEVAAKFVDYLNDLQAEAVEAEQRAKVNEILTAAGAYRKDIEAFLADRINKEASFVLTKINDFMSRPRNRKAKEYVDIVLSKPTPDLIVTLPETVKEAA